MNGMIEELVKTKYVKVKFSNKEECKEFKLSVDKLAKDAGKRIFTKISNDFVEVWVIGNICNKIEDLINGDTVAKVFRILKDDSYISERSIIQSRLREKPFVNFDGNKSELVRVVLMSMVESGLIEMKNIGKTSHYKIK